MFPLGSVRGDARRNRAHAPSFRRRRVTTPSVSAPVSTTKPFPSFVSFFIKDEEVSPHDANLRPHKMKPVDVGEGVPRDR